MTVFNMSANVVQEHAAQQCGSCVLLHINLHEMQSSGNDGMLDPSDYLPATGWESLLTWEPNP